MPTSRFVPNEATSKRIAARQMPAAQMKVTNWSLWPASAVREAVRTKLRAVMHRTVA